MPGNVNIAFTKLYAAADTKVILTGSATLWASVGGLPVQARLGVNINSTSYDIDNVSMNALNVRHKFYGVVEVTGLAAGAYTAGLVWKNTNASTTINIDAAQWLSLRVEEVPA
jgi:hypothetical protein